MYVYILKMVRNVCVNVRMVKGHLSLIAFTHLHTILSMKRKPTTHRWINLAWVHVQIHIYVCTCTHTYIPVLLCIYTYTCEPVYVYVLFSFSPRFRITESSVACGDFRSFNSAPIIWVYASICIRVCLHVLVCVALRAYAIVIVLVLLLLCLLLLYCKASAATKADNGNNIVIIIIAGWIFNNNNNNNSSKWASQWQQKQQRCKRKCDIYASVYMYRG